MIFGDKGSGAFSAEAALAEAGAPYDFETVSLEKNEQRQPEFLAINPSGKIPALRLPEGEIVTESLAILLTLADHFPQARLLPPQASPARGTGLSLARLHGGEIYPMVEIADYPAALRAGGRSRRRRLRAEGAGAHPRAASDRGAAWSRGPGSCRADFPSSTSMPRCSRAGAEHRQRLAGDSNIPQPAGAGGSGLRTPAHRAGLAAAFH